MKIVEIDLLIVRIGLLLLYIIKIIYFIFYIRLVFLFEVKFKLELV